MDVKQIIALVVLLVVTPVSLAVGVVVTFETTGSIDVESSRTNYTDQLVNTDFSDNTGSQVDNWDNDTAGTGVANAWNASGYGTTTTTDNDNTQVDNGTWSQSATVSSIHHGVSSVTVSFEYRVIDNENVQSITLSALLDDGSDNSTVWQTTTTENSGTWTAQENSMLSVVDAAGTYTLWLRAEITPENTGAGSNVQVGWDDANLVVVSYAKGYLENAVEDVESQTDVGFSLASLLPLIVAAVALISVIVVGFYGLYQRAR